MSTTYHVPVLFDASLDGLALQPGGTYVDCTFGGGGHSRGILERLGPEGRLFGFDCDPDAADNVPDDPRFHLIPENFRFASNFLRLQGVQQVDGILADLGVSSHQFDAVGPGHRIVDDHCVESVPCHRQDRFPSSSSDFHVEPGAIERGGQQLSNTGRIVHDEDPGLVLDGPRPLTRDHPEEVRVEHN